MAPPTIIDAPRVAKFTVAGSTDTFNLPSTFPVFIKDGDETDADLEVYVDGTLKSSSEWSFSGTFTDGVAPGGDVVFDSTISSGTVFIFGAMPGRRTSNFTAGGIDTDKLNVEINRIWAALREMQDSLKRAGKVPFTEADADDSFVDQLLPALATRQGQGAAWDANGRWTVGTSTALEEILIAVNQLTSGAADKGVYWTAADAAALFDLTSFARSILDDADAGAVLTTLGVTSFIQTLLDDADAGTARATLGLVIGTDVQAFDADTLKADTADTLTKGFDATPNDAGTVDSGTFTPDPHDQNLQKYTNGGAHTLAPPGKDCTLTIKCTNNGSAGAITTSGFTVADDAALDTTNGSVFLFYITEIDGTSRLQVEKIS